MSSAQKLGRILAVPPEMLTALDAAMMKATGKKGVLDELALQNERSLERVLKSLEPGPGAAFRILSTLRETIFWHEKELFRVLASVPGSSNFERAAHLAKKMARVGTGTFLKMDRIADIFEKRPPQNLLKYLGYSNATELLKKEDPAECFSALRFVETNEWMHATFEEAYGGFTQADFEEREITIKVLGPQWWEIAKKFVEKKHHNVSHLKEFGVIFLNPIAEDLPGKFLRDFALLLHYFHEVQFYSKLFRKYFAEPDFVGHFKSLLRGDVKEATAVGGPNEWLIVQRYLMKENPNDPRLFLPRVNPESMHWARGERDIANFAAGESWYDLKLWGDLDWVGDFFSLDGSDALVSFDLEDNAMSLVSFMEGKQQFFTYHQREAMWTKLFSDYVGGEERMEELLVANFDKGVISF